MISEISGGQGQNKNLSSRISALDEQVVKQQELLYNVEFQLQQMERKVRMQLFKGLFENTCLDLSTVVQCRVSTAADGAQGACVGSNHLGSYRSRHMCVSMV